MTVSFFFKSAMAAAAKLSIKLRMNEPSPQRTHYYSCDSNYLV